MTINSASLFALGTTNGAAQPHGNEGSKTGTVSSTAHGDGTFATTLEIVNGQKTIDKVVTYADGTQKVSERVVTVNDDGSKTITKTNKNGKTTTIQESQVKNDDGTITVAKEVTNAKGEVTEISGTISRSHGEVDKTFTCTHSGGLSETISRQTIHDGNVTTHIKSGTGYYGNPIYNESTWTTFV